MALVGLAALIDLVDKVEAALERGDDDGEPRAAVGAVGGVVGHQLWCGHQLSEEVCAAEVLNERVLGMADLFEVVLGHLGREAALGAERLGELVRVAVVAVGEHGGLLRVFLRTR